MNKKQLGTKILTLTGFLVMALANALTKKADERVMEEAVEEAVNRRLAECEKERDSVVITIDKES